MHDLTTPEGVAAYMSESLSEEDWNDRCDLVALANGGELPVFWFATIISSGLARRVNRYGSTDINITNP